MKKIILALAIGLVMAIGGVGGSSAQTEKEGPCGNEVSIISCCFTDSGKWCCSIGFPPMGCQCTTNNMAGEGLTPPPQGPYLGKTFQESIQNMLKEAPMITDTINKSRSSDKTG